MSGKQKKWNPMEDKICGKPIKLGTSRDGTIDFSYDVSVFPGNRTQLLVGGLNPSEKY